jgi:hypothetical protein
MKTYHTESEVVWKEFCAALHERAHTKGERATATRASNASALYAVGEVVQLDSLREAISRSKFRARNIGPAGIALLREILGVIPPARCPHCGHLMKA